MWNWETNGDAWLLMPMSPMLSGILLHGSWHFASLSFFESSLIVAEHWWKYISFCKCFLCSTKQILLSCSMNTLNAFKMIPFTTENEESLTNWHLTPSYPTHRFGVSVNSSWMNLYVISFLLPSQQWVNICHSLLFVCRNFEWEALLITCIDCVTRLRIDFYRTWWKLQVEQFHHMEKFVAAQRPTHAFRGMSLLE